MKSIKRILTALLSFALLLSLFSCGNEEKPTDFESVSEQESGAETVYIPDIPDGKVFYADPAALPGGDGSSESPVSTFGEALSLAEDYMRENNADASVYLRKGDYVLDDVQAVKGCGNKKLTFVGESGATLTTAETVSGRSFALSDDNIYSCTLGEVWDFRDVILDNDLLHVARGTEYRFVFDSAKGGDGTPVLYVDPAAVADIVTDESGYILRTDIDGKGIAGARTTAEMSIKTEWQSHIIHIEKINKTPVSKNGNMLCAVTVTATDWSSFRTGYARDILKCGYTIWNNYALLDEPGEFYYDSVDGILYLYSESAVYKKTVKIPRGEKLLTVSDTENITFRNVTFTGLTMNYPTNYTYMCGQAASCKTGPEKGFFKYDAIYGKNVKNLTLDHCTFENMGNDAVFVCGAVSDLCVKDSLFRNIGGTALRIGENNSTYNDTVYNKNILIENNTLLNIGSNYPCNNAIFVSSVKDMTIGNNTIIGTPYTAISVGYDWTMRMDKEAGKYDIDSFVNVKNVRITGNYIEDFVREMSDGGAIYVLGGNATKNVTNTLNKIDNNCIVVRSDISGVGAEDWKVFHIDPGASHWEITENLVISSDKVSPPTGYCFFNANDKNAAAYCNVCNKLYVVGYPTAVGDGRLALMGQNDVLVPSHTYTVDAVTGAYTATNSDTLAFRNTAAEIYLYQSFADATPAASDAMTRIYNASGSSSYAYTKLTYGTLPQ